MVNVKYKKNPGNVHSVKCEIYVQNCTQHLIIFANPLTIFARFAVACISGHKERTEGGAKGLKALGCVFFVKQA